MSSPEAGGPEPHDLKTSTVKAIAWSAIDSWASRAVTLVTIAILARLISAEAFGVVAFATVFVDLFLVLTSGGLSKALVRKPELTQAIMSTAFWLSTALGVAFTVVVAVVCFVGSQIYDGQYDFLPVVGVLAMVFTLRGVSAVPEALLQREMQFRTLAMRRVIATIVGAACGIAAAFMGAEVWSLVIQILVTAAIGSIILCFMSPFRPSRHFDHNEARDLFRFGKNVVGIDLLTFITSNADNLFVGIFLGPVALGYYAIAFRLLSTVTDLIAGDVNAVALPVFSRLQNDTTAVGRALMKATQLSVGLAAPIFVFLAAAAPFLIPFVFGPNWSESVPLFQLMCLVGLMRSAATFDRSILLALDRSHVEFGVTLIGALISVVVFGITVQFGLTAVTIGLVIRTYLMWPIRLRALRHAIEFDLGAYLFQWIKPVVLSLVASVPLWFFGGDAARDLYTIALIALSGVIYLGLTWAFSRDFFLEVMRLGPLLVRRGAKA